MPKTRAFCTYESLEEIISKYSSAPYTSAFGILCRECDIFLLDKVDLEALTENGRNPILRKIMKRVNRDIFTDKKLEEHIENPQGDDIFLLLPPTYDKYKDYKDTKGVLVIKAVDSAGEDLEADSGVGSEINEDSSDDDILNILFDSDKEKLPDHKKIFAQGNLQTLENFTLRGGRHFNILTEFTDNERITHLEKYERFHSWNDVFSSFPLLPVNAALINDNYLFHKQNYDRREKSLYSILKNIIPSALEVPFHLTIFVENTNNELKRDKMVKVVEEIHNLGKEVGADIKVSIIGHMLKGWTHDRVLLTNFHYMTSGIGFSPIDQTGKVKENAKGHVSAIFKDSLFVPKSELTMKEMHSNMIALMKEIYHYGKGGGIYAFRIGDEFENRLLKKTKEEIQAEKEKAQRNRYYR